ncbi:MAG: 50S ribosomal protein L4 [Candidatus Liptonbacteria bacterium RIFCSPLOWO2_01_FULL_52_25]|uniref:Large ribosomal subunit protein uL4 n=1 Tax=Candidatus Liptonbacteria bacterium RIFCSPLOWO2_01_FULL_52_25 TaxID=1798650 RepID=A0A1G2CD09_9BACT|nr:MAG: 50S ribosomal protein L4 [Candidatus Liptonbacteria bacterium RIFCSPLOWO2_01_FULL_52_25]
MKVDVYNLKNEKVGTVELPEKIFGVKWSPLLVQQIVRAQLANKRRPWAHAKTRAEVRGGGRKPWRQKGTGRARHGSTRSPLWVGGGKAHGPNKERDFSQKVNKKMRRAALFSILSRKLKDGDVKIVDSLAVAEPKTKLLFAPLRAALGLTKAQKNFDVLLITEHGNKNVVRASSNIPKAKAVHPESLNVYDSMNHKHIFIEKSAVAEIAKHYQLDSRVAASPSSSLARKTNGPKSQ